MGDLLDDLAHVLLQPPDLVVDLARDVPRPPVAGREQIGVVEVELFADFEDLVDMAIHDLGDRSHPGVVMGLLDRTDRPLHGVLDQGGQLAGERLELGVLVGADALQLQRHRGLALWGSWFRLERLDGLLERRPSRGPVATDDGRPQVQVAFVQGVLCRSTDPGKDAADERGHDQRGWVHRWIPPFEVALRLDQIDRIASLELCHPSQPPRAVRHRRGAAGYR